MALASELMIDSKELCYYSMHAIVGHTFILILLNCNPYTITDYDIFFIIIIMNGRSLMCVICAILVNPFRILSPTFLRLFRYSLFRILFHCDSQVVLLMWGMCLVGIE